MRRDDEGIPCPGQSIEAAGSPLASPEENLRKQAEERIRLMGDRKLESLPPGERIERLFHELQVHQIELEMQNEELRRTQGRLSAARDRYFDLYDLAPVGYVTLNAEGLIQEANLTMAALLGVPRATLIAKPLSRSIFAEDQDIYYLHFRKIIETGQPQFGEVRLVRPDGRLFWGRLTATSRSKTETGDFECRVTLTDITDRKEMEEGLRRSRKELEQRVQERTAELNRLNEILKSRSRMLESFFQHTLNSMVFLDRDFNFLRVNAVYAQACQRPITDFPGRNHFEFYPNEENEAIFRQVVASRAPYQAIAKPFVFPDHPEWGTTYWDWTLTPLLDDGGEVEYLVFSLMDVTETKRVELAIRENEQLQTRLNTLLSRSLADISLEEFLEETLDLLISLPWLEPISGGCIFLIDDDGESLILKAKRGLLENQTTCCDQTPFGICLCGRAVLEPELRFISCADGGHRQGKEDLGPHAHYLVPIRSFDRTYGLINLYLNGPEAQRNQQKEGFLSAIADTLASILVRKSREREVKESEKRLRFLSAQLLEAQEKERKRIALEVHDILGSSLSAIKFKVEDILQRIDEISSGQVIANLENLLPFIKETIGNARRIQMDLRPPHLDDLGVVATLQWFCNRFRSFYASMVVEQDLLIEETLVPKNLKLTIFRIVQEAMNNIAKHAGADHVLVGLRKKEDGIELHIEDNGTGFDPIHFFKTVDSEKGMGISSMIERTEMFGGRFSVESTLGKGTIVKAVWPE